MIPLHSLGPVTLVRFAILIALGSSSSSATHHPVVPSSLRSSVGTPQYMAPEVFKRDYDQAADLWSVGVIMVILHD